MPIDIEQLKSSISIVDLVQLSVPLQRRGKVFVGLCPFHDESNPSLTIYPDEHSIYCFGCGWHGDAISWVEAKLGLTFGEAVRWLQDRVGILPKTRQLPDSRLYTPTAPIPKMILEYWHSLVISEVRDYYHQRCLTDETIDLYMLGYDGTNYVIPIWEGKPRESLVYGAKFRCPEGAFPKYFGLRGRSQPRLFNSFVLKDAKEAVIVFGEFDAILAYQMGLDAVSPTSGQNTWLVEWTKLFDNCETVFVLPDRGERAAGYRLCSLFGARGHLCEFPIEAKDLTEYMQKGYTITNLKDSILHKNMDSVEFTIESYWEETNELSTDAARI